MADKRRYHDRKEYLIHAVKKRQKKYARWLWLIKTGNAFYYVLTVTVRFMQDCCSFHEKSWLKNRVNSGKPKLFYVIARVAF